MSIKTHLDLFSGIGGFALAASWAGYTTIGFCEIDPYAQKVLSKRFGSVLAYTDCERRQQESRGTHGHEAANEGWPKVNNNEPSSNGESRSPRIYPDIKQLDGTQFKGVDLLTGGFPCQPFSLAGKRAGKADDRHLWPEMLRVIDESRPNWVLGENVPGIISMELDRVLSDLENIGYACWPVTVPACAVDARHRRSRVWIVAHSESQQFNGSKPDSNKTRRNGSSNSSEAAADAERPRLEERQEQPAWEERETSERNGNAIPHAECKHDDESGYGAGEVRGIGPEPSEVCGPSEWLPEPELGRVAHGIPHRVDRLRGLGNAIVPQVAYQLIKLCCYHNSNPPNRHATNSPSPTQT